MPETFEAAVDEMHAALAHFVNGDPRPARRLFSDRSDVVLCNPLVPFAIGPQEVMDVMSRAASHFAAGRYEYEPVTSFSTDDLGYIVEVERFTGTVNGRESSGALRVTMIFRREEAGWRVSHRHADAVTTPRSIESILEP